MEHISSIAQLLSISIEKELKEPDSLSEMEQEIRRQMVEAGRQALANCLEKVRERYPAESSACAHCEGEAAYVRQRTGTLHTVLGRVKYKRSYYLCPVCHRGTYPLDQRLGLRPNQLVLNWNGSVARRAWK